jgi:hypothetical protein
MKRKSSLKDLLKNRKSTPVK